MTGDGAESRNIRAITDRVARNLAGLVRPPVDEGLLLEAVRANVRAAAYGVRSGSRLLKELIAAGRVAVVGAVCELETGTIHFLDGPWAEARSLDDELATGDPAVAALPR
jgi:hypothetical protein